MGAFALAPVAAHAADTDATGTLTTGGLSNTAPAITPFNYQLTGSTATVTTNVGAWNVIDATGSNDGYSVTVAASCPDRDRRDSRYRIVADTDLDDGHGGGGQPSRHRAGRATGPQLLSPDGATIDNAPAGTGQGEWDFPADTGAGNLSIVIPGDASAGDYSSTLTFTTAPPVT